MRRWLRILPAVFITYSLAYLDRSNFGFGVAGGMAQTLALTQQQISLLAAVFFLGYFLFQIPGARLVRRMSLRRLVGGLLVVWGAMAALTGVVHSLSALIAIRFLLGLAESLVFPAMLLMLTRWFTRAERSRANAFLILGNPVTVLWMSAATGYVIQSYGWRATFVVEGVPSILWGFIWFLTMPDEPAEARWLTNEEKQDLQRTLDAEQVTVPRMGLRRAMLNGNTLLLAALYFFWSLGIYGFVLWLPVIVKRGSNLAMGRSGLLTALPYAVSIVAMLLVSYFSDKVQRREAFVWPSLAVATLSLLGSYLMADVNVAVAFLCLVLGAAGMYAPYGPFFASVPEHVPANATVEVMALINGLGALGGFAGSYLVGLLQGATGSSRGSFLLMSASLLLATVLCLFLKPERAGVIKTASS